MDSGVEYHRLYYLEKVLKFKGSMNDGNRNRVAFVPLQPCLYPVFTFEHFLFKIPTSLPNFLYRYFCVN